MFLIPQETLDFWAKEDEPKATAVDVRYIEDYLRGTLPAPYVEFITTYGYVEFPENRDGFEYTVDYGSQVVRKAAGISILFDAHSVVEAHGNMTDPNGPAEEGIPAYPQKYLPIGVNAGQSEILLELGGITGRIWFWQENEWPWGQEGNTHLGFIADNMYDFINGLRDYEEFL